MFGYMFECCSISPFRCKLLFAVKMCSNRKQHTQCTQTNPKSEQLTLNNNMEKKDDHITQPQQETKLRIMLFVIAIFHILSRSFGCVVCFLVALMTHAMECILQATAFFNSQCVAVSAFLL